MTLTQRQRRILLATALVATLLAVRWTAGREAELQEAEGVPAAPAMDAATRRQTAATADASGLPVLELERLEHLRPDTSAVVRDAPRDDLFSVRTAPAPAPAAPRPAPPAVQLAPPVPYAYQGKVTEAGQTVVFLAATGRNYLARTGDVLDGAWRVDDIGERSMALTYLPLNTRQSLSTGTAK